MRAKGHDMATDRDKSDPTAARGSGRRASVSSAVSDAPRRTDQKRMAGIRRMLDSLANELESLGADNMVLEAENSRLRETLRTLRAPPRSGSGHNVGASTSATYGRGRSNNSIGGVGASTSPSSPSGALLTGASPFPSPLLGCTATLDGPKGGPALVPPTVRQALFHMGSSLKLDNGSHAPSSQPLAKGDEYTSSDSAAKAEAFYTSLTSPQDSDLGTSRDSAQGNRTSPRNTGNSRTPRSTSPATETEDEEQEATQGTDGLATFLEFTSDDEPLQQTPPEEETSSGSKTKETGAGKGKHRETDHASALGIVGWEDEVSPILSLWSTWDDTHSVPNISVRRLRGSTSHILSLDTRRTGETLRTDGVFQRFVSKPSSPRRILWDFISVVVMSYDIITIPLQVFQMEETQAEFYISILTTVFWGMDIIASFFAGYHIEGLIEMRPAKVSLHYLRTWFTVDFFVVCIDLSVLIFRADNMEGIGVLRLNKTLRIMRVLRVLRLLRLLRMLKVMSVMSELYDMIHSEFLVTAIGIFQFVLGILLVNHYFACCWYGIAHMSGQVNSRPGDNWVAVLRNSYLERFGQDPTIGYYYFTCLHWSLTQFTPASMEVVPINLVERIYTIAVLLCAMLLFSSLLSSITTSMIALRAKSTERRRQQGFVRRYITEKHVTLDLGNRISGFLRHHNFNVVTRKAVHEADINAFKILPESLRTQLRYEVYVPVMTRHPIFQHFQDTDDETLTNMVTTSCVEQDLAYGQEKFARGYRATHMFAIVQGTCRYYHGASTDPLEAQDVSTRTFISEPVLWMNWEHKGRLVAMSNIVEFVALSSVLFRSVIRRAPHCWSLCKLYAQEYRKRTMQIVEERQIYPPSALTWSPETATGEDSLSDLPDEIIPELIAYKVKEEFASSMKAFFDARGGASPTELQHPASSAGSRYGSKSSNGSGSSTVKRFKNWMKQRTSNNSGGINSPSGSGTTTGAQPIRGTWTKVFRGHFSSGGEKPTHSPDKAASGASSAPPRSQSA